MKIMQTNEETWRTMKKFGFWHILDDFEGLPLLLWVFFDRNPRLFPPTAEGKHPQFNSETNASSEKFERNNVEE